MEVYYNRLFFRALVSGNLPRYSGGMVRGMLFKAMGAVDPALTEQIHDQKGIKKFSLSGLHPFKNVKRRGRVLAGDIFYVDVITVDGNLNDVLQELLQDTWTINSSNLEFQPLQIREVDVDRILEQEFNNHISIRFSSPLSFSSGSTYFVWPEPGRILQNLLSMWNTWFPTQQMKIDVQEVAQGVRVRSARGKVRTAEVTAKMFHTGWTGQVDYLLTDEESGEVFTNLLKFGFMTGVGRGRTSGLGRFYFPSVLHHYDLSSL